MKCTLQRQLLLLAVLAAWLSGGAYGQGLFDSGTAGFYNPCQSPPSSNNAVLRGDSFVFGVSYWAGYTVPNWGPVYNTTTGTPGLNPCITQANVNGASINYTQYLGERGAVLTSYALQVDKLAVLRITKAEFDQMWDHIPVAQAKAISMIAFVGQNRSEARYAASNEAYLTQGVGVVTQTALIVNWNRGVFSGFEWYDFQTCSQCGGIYSDRCLRLQYDAVYQQYPQTSCGAPFAECACRGLGCVSGNCTTAIYVGHRGTDKAGAAMKSANQIQDLNKYSFTGFLSSLAQKINSAYDNTGSIVGPVGEGNTIIVQLPSASASQNTFQSTQTQQTSSTAATCDPTISSC